MMSFNACILDTETTGIYPPVQVVEVSRVLLEEIPSPVTSKVLNSFNQLTLLFSCSKPIEEKATELHGYTQESLKGYPEFSFSALRLPTSIKYLIGHNVNYDWRAIGSPEGLKLICTLKLARRLFPEIESYSLANLGDYLFPSYLRELEGTLHHAAYDMSLTQKLLQVILNKKDFSSWEELYEFSNSPIPKRVKESQPLGKVKKAQERKPASSWGEF